MNDQISRQKLIEELEERRSSMIPESDGRHSVSIETVIDYISKFPPVDQCVPLSEVYRVFAGHSDYHGDNILAALTCIAEGKDAKPVRPLPADQWIPCSSGRVPKEKEIVHVTILNEDSGERRTADTKFDGRDYAIRLDYSERIVAWMPANLPEPYKGE